MPVPFVDLTLQHQQVADEVRAGWDRVLSNGQFVLGAEVAAFESAFAAFAEVRHCVGVANGTDALELSLRAMGVGPGDEVIVPANTFIATALAVMRAGARPVLVDVDAASHLVDPAKVSEVIGERTRAVIPVHLYGQIAPMATLAEALAGKDVAVIEDAAQAHGARQGGVGAGGFGLLAATSFYPAKNLGAYGDGGAVLTNSDEMARAVRALRNYGGETKYEHSEIGFNSRLDTLQAVVLSAKLARLAGWNTRRRDAATRYHHLLADLEDVARPAALPGNEHVWHLYVVRVTDRDRVLGHLRDAGIGVGVHYPLPLHLQGALRSLGHTRGDFPVTERASQEILSLPMYPGITPEQQEEVVDQLRKALR